MSEDERSTIDRIEVEPKRIIVMLGLLAALVGSFLPWLTFTSAFGQSATSGFQFDGKITAVVAVAGILLVLTDSFGGPVLVAPAGVALACVGFYDVSQRASDSESTIFRATVGYGAYICVAGFIVAAVTAVTMTLSELRKRSESND